MTDHPATLYYTVEVTVTTPQGAKVTNVQLLSLTEAGASTTTLAVLLKRKIEDAMYPLLETFR